MTEIACALSTTLLFLLIVMGMILIVCGAVSGVMLVINRTLGPAEPSTLKET